jgi:hypothetical protein
LIPFLEGLAQQIREVHLCDTIRSPVVRSCRRARTRIACARTRTATRVGVWCGSRCGNVYATEYGTVARLAAMARCYALAWLWPCQADGAEGQFGWGRSRAFRPCAATCTPRRYRSSAKPGTCTASGDRPKRSSHRPAAAAHQPCTQQISLQRTQQNTVHCCNDKLEAEHAQTNTTSYDSDHSGPSLHTQSSEVSQRVAQVRLGSTAQIYAR